MEPSPQLVLRTLLLLGLFSVVANQVCDEGGYSVINEPRRSTQAVYDNTVDTPLCDYGIDEETWFRFASFSGDAVVERDANDPVPLLHCGTHAPIYIRGIGSHPVHDNAKTTATVCANYGGFDACMWMDTIQIYRCPVQGDPSYFYLYKLKSPPGCIMSYCVGEKPACNQGDYWNGFDCVNDVPAMKDSPIFSGPNTNGSGLSTAIYFSCHVQYDRQPNDNNARFRVTFLFDGQPLEYIGVNASSPPERLQPIILTPDSDLIAILDEFHLRGRLGRKISCLAESFWVGYEDAANSSMRSTAQYYVTFQSTAESFDVDLTSGSTFNVTFQSTVPLTCSHCSYSGCCIYRFRMMDYSAASVYCVLSWTFGYTAVMTTYFLPGATQAENSFALVFEPYVDDGIWGGRSLWRDYVIPTVKMTVLPQSLPYKACRSVGNSYQYTFDAAYFDNYLIGDFYLAKAINAIQLMEVQVRHGPCNGGQVACNCGVVVREGNSAFKISVCEAGSWSSAVQRSPSVVRLLSQDPGDSSSVYMDGTGLLFSIRMPSGLRVEVDATIPWFSLYVYLPPEYHGKTDTASMCGNSNGNPADDSTNPEQSRIPDSSSYFAHPPTCSSIFNVAVTRCGCNVTYPICSNTDPTLEYISAANNPFPRDLTSGVVCSQTPVSALASSYGRPNRDADNDFNLDDDILFPPYTYDPDFSGNVSFTWPTPTGKTEQVVEQYCSEMLQSSPAYADCSGKVDMATLIAMCVSDIQIADDWISARAYTFFFEQSCLNNIAASIGSSSDHSRDVSRKLCPNQCSDHGTCSGGTCICTTGFIGADCSIDQSLPPSLTGIIRGGVCDVSARPCDVISVFGSGVAFSSALMCRFTDQNTGAHAETKGTFVTAVEYSCPVPETTTHRRRRSVAVRTSALSTRKVSITVDGSVYSNTLDFVLFDSVCMECSSSDSSCRHKGNSCLIGDECFADMAVNPVDSTLQCISSVSRNSWTNVTDDAE